MTKVLGKIRTKSELQRFEGTDFTKIDLVVQDNNGTPFKLEFHKNKTELLETALLGSDVVVSFNIRGNFYDKKDSQGNLTGVKEVSNSLVAFDITIL